MPPRPMPDAFEGRGWDCFGCGKRGCGRGGGFGQGRGRGRLFDNGDLRLVILLLLSERPRHGYEIIKALADRVGGGYSPSPGVVYPTLTLLEDVGHAVVTEERAGRKLYTLTEDGHAALAEVRPVVDSILRRMDSSAATRGGPPPQVLRAVDNLMAAIRLRLEGQDHSPAHVLAITAALDAAARAVEEA